MRLIAGGVEESGTLDYKSRGALSKENAAEIAKDVSAMANSAGGVLIYGISEYPKDSPNAHLPEKLDPIDESEFSKEWLEHIIKDGIQPRLTDFLIHPIRLSEGGSVYVVAISQSMTAHQATKLTRYYRRYNFESVPMQDHEIRDVMHRVRHPQIRLSFEIRVAKAQADPMPLPMRQRDDSYYRWLKIGFTNIGERLAHHVRAKIMIPLSALVEPLPPVVRLNGILYREWDLDMAWPDSGGILSVPKKDTDPLLPKLNRKNTTIRLLAVDKTLPANFVFFAIYADEAPVFRDKILLSDLQATEVSDMDGLVREISGPP